MARGVVDLFLIYSFIKKLVTPFDQWEAFKQGVIDKDGNILIKKKDRNKLDQRRSLGYFDVLILNLKKLLGKIPGGKSRIATFAAALYLIRESKNPESPLLSESYSFHSKQKLLETIKECEINYKDEIDVLFEMMDEETVIIEDYSFKKTRPRKWEGVGFGSNPAAHELHDNGKPTGITISGTKSGDYYLKKDGKHLGISSSFKFAKQAAINHHKGIDEETVTGLVAGIKQGDEPPKPNIKKPRMLRRITTF